MDEGNGEPSDEELVEACRRGDQVAWAQLYRRHALRNLGWMARLAHRSPDPVEMAQGAFHDALEGCVRRFQADRGVGFVTYLRPRLAGAVRNALRAEARVGYLQGDLGEDLVAEDGDADLSVTVRKVLDQLDPDERELVHLKHWLGLSINEIADHLGGERNRVYRRYLAAMDKLKRLL